MLNVNVYVWSEYDIMVSVGMTRPLVQEKISWREADPLDIGVWLTLEWLHKRWGPHPCVLNSFPLPLSPVEHPVWSLLCSSPSYFHHKWLLIYMPYIFLSPTLQVSRIETFNTVKAPLLDIAFWLRLTGLFVFSKHEKYWIIPMSITWEDVHNHQLCEHRRYAAMAVSLRRAFRTLKIQGGPLTPLWGSKNGINLRIRDQL